MTDDSQMFEEAVSKVVDIGGGRADAGIRQNLEDAIKSKGYIDKPLFYRDPGWELVSKGSSQTKDECDILRRDAQLIARAMYGNGDGRQRLVIELGPGDFKKTKILLEALHELSCSVLYIAVDINGQRLKEIIPSLNQRWPNIQCFGIWGSFDEALESFETKSLNIPQENRHVWSFGSSLSNDAEDTVVNSLRRWSQLADSITIGQDGGTTDENAMVKHYQTPEFNEFFGKGLERGNDLLDQPHFSKHWEVQSQLRRNPTMHIFVLEARADTTFMVDATPVEIKQGQTLEAFASFKYGPEDLRRMVHRAGCTMRNILAMDGTESRIYVIKG